MSLNRKPNAAANSAIPECDLKLCSLCGALNHKDNVECFTCSWSGVFDRNEATIHFAWLRLYDECEAVSMEHVSCKKPVLVGELGAVIPANKWERTRAKVKAWWKEVMRQRDIRSGEREKGLRKPERFIA